MKQPGDQVETGQILRKLGVDQIGDVIVIFLHETKKTDFFVGYFWIRNRT